MTYSIGHKGTESLGCGNANESHCKTLFGLPAQLMTTGIRPRATGKLEAWGRLEK